MGGGGAGGVEVGDWLDRQWAGSTFSAGAQVLTIWS